MGTGQSGGKEYLSNGKKGKDGKGLEWQGVPFFSLDRATCHLKYMEN